MDPMGNGLYLKHQPFYQGMVDRIMDRRTACFQFAFFLSFAFQKQVTPWKINMEHNHGGLEDHFPF